jgi:hypothetical protein
VTTIRRRRLRLQRLKACFELTAGAVVHDGGLGGFERELFEADALLIEQAVHAFAQLGV